MHNSLQLLLTYAPTLFDCATRSVVTAKRVAAKYRERWRSMANALESKGKFEAMTCIFDLLWKASENRELAKEFLGFIDRTVKVALASTVGQAHVQLEKLVITMIVSFGEERSEYKNHFAEIAVIAKLVGKGELELKSIEKQLPNGHRIDLEICKDGNTNLVEVYNIDFIAEKLKSGEDLKQFLETRLVKKLLTKLEGIKPGAATYQLIPVLWGDIMALTAFKETFEYFRETRIVAPFMMVGQYKNPLDGSVEYDFESVENFLDQVLAMKRKL